MKKSLLILLLSSFALVGCNPAGTGPTPTDDPVIPPTDDPVIPPTDDPVTPPAQHTHTFSTEWKTDENKHWHEATCEHTDVKDSEGDHTFNADNKCTVCGYQKEVETKTIYSIKITKNPTKTQYFVGENFDPTGMEVTVHYTDKSTEVIMNYSIPNKSLQLGDTKVEISYCGFTASVAIVVKEKPTEELDEYTTTIDFHGSQFTTLFPEGTNFDIQAKFDALVNYIDDKLEYYDLINQISAKKCTTRKVDSDTFLQIGTGSPAKDKFNPGEFVWNCKEKIYNVEIVAFNYSNPYEDWQTHQTVHNVDNLGHIFIDDVDGSLEIGTNDAPKTITLSKSYDEGTSSFKLSSTGGRVLIKEMTITWRG